MKRIRHLLRRLLAAGLAAVLCGALPAALAADGEPPLYEVYGYASPEEFMELFLGGDEGLTYDMVSSKYALYIQALEADESLACNYYGTDSVGEAAEEWGTTREALIAELAAYLAIEDVSAMETDGVWDPDGLDALVAFGLVPRTPPAVSVQLNGKAIMFPDAQPESRNDRTMVPFRAIAETLGAAVGYADGAVTAELAGRTYAFAAGRDTLAISDAESGAVLETVALDAVPYEKEGRTYVPVRFFAEAFGLTVRWDEYEQVAVLYDRDALLDELNADFSIVNQWTAAQPEIDPEQALRTAAAIEVAYTAFNSIDGDEHYPMEGTLEVISQGGSVQLDLRLDLYALAALYAQESGWLLGMGMEDLAEKYRTELENARFEMIYNADTDMLYLRCPLLFGLLAEDAPEGAAAAADTDKWFSVSGLAESGGVGMMDMNPVVLVTGSFLPLAADAETAGEYIVSRTEQNCETWGNYSELWYRTHSMAQNCALKAGDSLFARSGSRYTAPVGSEEVWEDGSYFKGWFTLDVQTGGITGEGERRERDWFSDMLITYSYQAEASSARVEQTIHIKNQGILTMAVEMEQQPHDSSPAAQPPQEEEVVDFEQWVEGLWD